MGNRKVRGSDIFYRGVDQHMEGWISTFFFRFWEILLFFFGAKNVGASNFYDSGPIELKLKDPLVLKMTCLRFFI